MVNYQSQACSPLSGILRVPSDKSYSHRAVFLASIAEGESRVENLLMGADNKTTMNAMEAMGVVIKSLDDTTHAINGVGLFGLRPPKLPLDMGNSGTGMRLLSGLLAGQSFKSTLFGDSSLMKRPMKRIIEPLRKMGALITTSLTGTRSLHFLPGKGLRGIEYEIPISSAQVKSCLLLAALYARGSTRITEPMRTRNYTEKLLSSMGVPIQIQGRVIIIEPCMKLNALSLVVPADISSAAFFIVAATIIPNSAITLEDVGLNPTRTGIIHILKAMGAHIVVENKREVNSEPIADLHVFSARLKGIEIPQSMIPSAIDELPIILIAAASAEGVTILRGAQELRVKESDRLEAMATGLKKLGIKLESYPDGMRLHGGNLGGGSVDSFTDHRIAMSFLVAGSVAKDPVQVKHCHNIGTSFPNFQKMANALGMKINLL